MRLLYINVYMYLFVFTVTCCIWL